MSPPPIPHYCQYFIKAGSDGVWHFLPARLGNGSANLGTESVTWSVDGDFGWMRGIIAAVARCAWLDEAAKLDMLDAGELVEMDTDPVGDARDNADAWAKWGKVS